MKTVPENELAAQDLQRWKLLERVIPLLKPLHEVGCERDKAGNRELHFDEYVILVLLYLFNPLIDSLQTLQKVSDLPEVQKRLGIQRFSLGSFSESCRVFDPEQLKTVVEQLAGELQPVGREELLKDLPGRLTLVDSTLIQTLVSVAEAMFMPHAKGPYRHAWRLHLQLDVDHHVPTAWEVTPPKNTGKADEKNVLRRKLEAGHTYVMDRWYAQFVLWNDIKAAGSSYICRVRDNSVYRVLKEQILSCRHLLSSKPQGVQIQIYAAVICCMLLNVLTGTKPTKWHVTLMALYLQGLATEADVLRELNKPDRKGEKL